MVIRSNFVVAN